MPKSQSNLERELYRRQLLIQSCRNRLVLASEIEKLKPAAAVADQGIEIARLARAAFGGLNAGSGEGGGSRWSLPRLLALAKAAIGVWRLFRSQS